MRWAVFSFLFVSLTATSLFANEPVRWQPPFHPLSGSAESSGKIIVSVITNDDPLGLSGADDSLWCAGALERRCATLFAQRGDLADQLVFQAVPAGRPAILTGGEPRNQPARVVIAFCDPQFRLLGMCVGVPEVDALRRLIEDAQEVSRLLGTAAAERAQVQQQIAAQRTESLPRLWKEAMKVCLESATAIPVDTPSVSEASARGDAGPAAVGSVLLAERALADLAPVYREDVRGRFGITEPQDWRQLGVLEQHLETRGPWCGAILPALVGLDWETIWEPVVGAVWNGVPFRPQPADSQLLTWFQWHLERDGLVLAVRPTARRRPGGETQLVSADPRSEGRPSWSALRQEIESMPLRRVTTEQVVALLDEQDVSPIDLYQPSPGRYVIFEPGEPAPAVIRHADNPSKWTRRIKRIRRDRR